MLLLPAEAGCHAVSLSELLAGRDERQSRQQAWLMRHRLPLVSFTIVAPGPVKDNQVTRRIFNHGVKALHQVAEKAGWKIRQWVSLALNTGPEALFAIDATARDAKCAAIELECSHPLGRLWDIDVLAARGEILSRRNFALSARRCLMCERPAAVCARGRTHPLSDLLFHMGTLLHDADHIISN